MPILGKGGVMGNLLVKALASPVNQRHARCMRNSSSNFLSLLMPYR